MIVLVFLFLLGILRLIDSFCWGIINNSIKTTLKCEMLFRIQNTIWLYNNFEIKQGYAKKTIQDSPYRFHAIPKPAPW